MKRCLETNSISGSIKNVDFTDQLELHSNKSIPAVDISQLSGEPQPVKVQIPQEESKVGEAPKADITGESNRSSNTKSLKFEQIHTFLNDSDSDDYDVECDTSHYQQPVEVPKEPQVQSDFVKDRVPETQPEKVKQESTRDKLDLAQPPAIVKPSVVA